MRDTLVEVRAKPLLDVLADWPTEEQPETLIKRLV